MRNLLDDSGYTSLHCSVINESEECASILLKNGASQRVFAFDGISPLFLACAHGIYKNIALLCDDPQFSPDERVCTQPLQSATPDSRYSLWCATRRILKTEHVCIFLPIHLEMMMQSKNQSISS
jgi:hypothetical protein